MDISHYVSVVFWVITFFLVGQVYLYFARKFSIVDVPNHRSSHTVVTVRGGGVILWLGSMVYFYVNHAALPYGNYLILAIFFMGAVSFLDDILSLPLRIRFLVQLITATLFAYVLLGSDEALIYMLLLTLVIASTVNSFNFMDGINGLSGSYLFVLLLFFTFVAPSSVGYSVPLYASLLVFLFFNFRPNGRAIWFGGDVGSIITGFIASFLVYGAITSTGNLSYILLTTVYGVDSFWTIVYRLFKGENIFKAHRRHLFQLMVNEYGMQHLHVTGIYCFVQILINIIVYFQLTYFQFNDFYFTAIALILFSAVYFGIRRVFFKVLPSS